MYYVSSGDWTKILKFWLDCYNISSHSALKITRKKQSLACLMMMAKAMLNFVITICIIYLIMSSRSSTVARRQNSLFLYHLRGCCDDMSSRSKDNFLGMRVTLIRWSLTSVIKNNLCSRRAYHENCLWNISFISISN